MRIFVTGGSGFIGGHVIETLSRRHTVLAMARSPRSAAQVAARGATAVEGDLSSVDARHLADCDAVVHCAAFVEEYGTRQQFWSVNVDGTSRLLDAAQRAGVRRFVHIGTEAALFTGDDLVDVDEDAPLPVRHRYLYSETKAEAERRVLAAAASGLSTAVLRPRLVWGPRDTTILPAITAMARQGRWAWLDHGRARTSTTHVANLVHAVELALERGASGRAWFIADPGETTLRTFLGDLAATAGVQLPERSLPGGVARPLAATIEGAWRTLGLRGQPPMTAFSVAMMSRNVTVRTDRAQAELGYQPVIDRDQGLAELAAARS